MDDLAVGTTLYLGSSSELSGYYKLNRIDEREGKPVLNLVPEVAWSIDDPVQRRHHQIALSFTRFWHLWIVEEHAPACRVCGEMWPCQHVKDLGRLDSAIRDMEETERKRHQAKETRRRFKARYSTPGVCPACQRPVAVGQPFRTFEVNAVVKDGPPVTYHLSAQCAADTRHHSLHDYLSRLKKMNNPKENP